MTQPLIRWISSTEEALWEEMKLSETGAAGVPELTVTHDTFQIVEGFGGCFNELGWTALGHLPEKERAALLHALFHPEGEHKFSICRLPIGASDYALEWYSLNETDGDLAMEHFSVERDKKYLIPYIKEALALNPNLKLFASPWSPPTWMKFPKAYNFGTLRWEKDILEAYALYFVKFVQAYQAEGITIHQIHVQNEVAADQKFPSCLWTGEQLREFIRDYLGPAFDKHRIDAEIWLGTINAPEQTVQDLDGYAQTVLSDPEAYKYIKGIGYQWAGKHGIQRTVMSYPELRYMQTENECGDGRNSWFHAKYVFNLYQHYFTNGANAYIYWNMALEPKGSSTWGWEQNSMLTVDPAARSVIRNPEYFVMKHFAHFVAPGSRRLGLQGSWTGNASAFATPSGERVVVIANPFRETRTVRIAFDQGVRSFVLKPESFNTIVYNG